MNYFKPKDIQEALDLKSSQKKSVFLAGGTNLNSIQYISNNPGALISLENLNLASIRKNYIGSMATLEEIRINKLLPASIRTAAAHIVNRNIRNIATIGGNIASNKSSSDMIGVLIALDAVLEYYTLKKEKKNAPVSAWIQKPAGLITAIKIPEQGKIIYQRRFSRTKNDIPLLKLTAGYKITGDRVNKIIIAAGCVAPKIITLDKTSEYLNRTGIKDISIKKLQSIAQSEIFPVRDQRAGAVYKRGLLNASLEELAANIQNEN